MPRSGSDLSATVVSKTLWMPPSPPRLTFVEKRGPPEHRPQRELSQMHMQVVSAYATWFEEIISKWQQHIDRLVGEWQTRVNSFIDETIDRTNHGQARIEGALKQMQHDIANRFDSVESRLGDFQSTLLSQCAQDSSDKRKQQDLLKTVNETMLAANMRINEHCQDIAVIRPLVEAVDNHLKHEHSSAAKRKQFDIIQNMHDASLAAVDKLSDHREELSSLRPDLMAAVALCKTMEKTCAKTATVDQVDQLQTLVRSSFDDVLSSVKPLQKDVDSVLRGLKESNAQVASVRTVAERLTEDFSGQAKTIRGDVQSVTAELKESIKAVARHEQVAEIDRFLRESCVDELNKVLVTVNSKVNRIGKATDDIPEKLQAITKQTASDLLKAGASHDQLSEIEKSIRENRVDELKSAMKTMDSKLSRIERKVDPVVEQIEEVSKQIASDKLQTGGLEVRAKECSDGLAELTRATKKSMESLKDLSSHTGQVEEVKQGIARMSEFISQTKIEGIADQVNWMHSSLQSFKQRMQFLSHPTLSEDLSSFAEQSKGFGKQVELLRQFQVDLTESTSVISQLREILRAGGDANYVEKATKLKDNMKQITSLLQSLLQSDFAGKVGELKNKASLFEKLGDKMVEGMQKASDDITSASGVTSRVSRLMDHNFEEKARELQANVKQMSASGDRVRECMNPEIETKMKELARDITSFPAQDLAKFRQKAEVFFPHFDAAFEAVVPKRDSISGDSLGDQTTRVMQHLIRMDKIMSKEEVRSFFEKLERSSQQMQEGLTKIEDAELFSGLPEKVRKSVEAAAQVGADKIYQESNHKALQTVDEKIQALNPIAGKIEGATVKFEVEVGKLEKVNKSMETIRKLGITGIGTSLTTLVGVIASSVPLLQSMGSAGQGAPGGNGTSP